MASEKVELLEELYMHWGQGDFAGPEAFFGDDFTFTLGPDFPDAGVYVGAEGAAAYWRPFLQAWQKLTIKLEELIEAEDRVLARVLQTGTGVTSEIEIELRYFQLWSFSGARPVAMEAIMGEDEARAKFADA